MTRRLRCVLLGLPLALAALAGLAWLALDTWLESAGGRRAIEDVLSAQSGYPVSLAGEFEVVLLPVPGVSGTDLRVGGAPGEDVLATSARYGVSLDLRALLRREVNVNRLTLGDVRFGATDGLLVPEIEITGFAADCPRPHIELSATTAASSSSRSRSDSLPLPSVMRSRVSNRVLSWLMLPPAFRTGPSA